MFLFQRLKTKKSETNFKEFVYLWTQNSEMFKSEEQLNSVILIIKDQNGSTNGV